MNTASLSNLKKSIHNECIALIKDKLNNLHSEFRSKNEALLSESKSTAGDKHETGRAMIQLEQEKLSQQLQQWEKIKQFFNRLNPENKCSKVSAGALIQTQDHLYYIAAGLGKLEISGHSVFVIGPASPIAQQLLGMTVGESTEFQGKLILIEALT